jgi:hypothetical protein
MENEKKKKISIIDTINNLSKERLEELISNSTSAHNIIKNFGINPRESHIKLINKKISEYELESTKYILRDKITKTNEDLFVNGSICSRGTLIGRILKDSLIEHICSICNLGSEWNDEKLVLQLDHINGINNDNRIENLRFLCPNCHAQTDMFGGKQLRKIRICACGSTMWGPYNKCEECYIKSGKRSAIHIKQKTNTCICGRLICNDAKCCDTCAKLNSRVFCVSKDELHDMINVQKLSYVAIGKKFNVSDVAIKKRCKILGIDIPIRNKRIEKAPNIEPNNTSDTNDNIKTPKIIVTDKPIKIQPARNVRVTKVNNNHKKMKQ